MAVDRSVGDLLPVTEVRSCCGASLTLFDRDPGSVPAGPEVRAALSVPV